MKNSHLIFDKIKELATVDLRSLALFRVCLALLVICDLYIRSQDISTFYTDQGISPRDVFLDNFANPWHFSIHLFSGQYLFQAFLFLLNLFFLLLFLFGYKTRLMTFICWFFFVSIGNRNYEILTGADVLVRMTLFWSMFLPLGHYFSIDKALSENKEEVSEKYTSPVVIVYALQIVILYVFTALLKTGAEWQTEHTAVYFALKLEEFATPFAYIMLKFPLLLKLLTAVTLFIEKYGTILLFCPIFTPIVRTVGAFMFIFLQAGFASCLTIGMFPFSGMIVMIPMITTWFWDKVIFKFVDLSKANLVIYYDGCCAFCRKLTLVLKEFLILKNTKVLPASENESIQHLMEENNSWVVSNGDNKSLRFEGIIEVFKASPIFFFLEKIFTLEPIKQVGNCIYDCVANNRKYLSKLTKCLEPSNLRLSCNLFFEGLIPILLILMILAWNISGLKIGFHFPKQLRPIVSIFRFDQHWNMFAAYPRKDNGWYVIEANLRDGTKVDLFRNGKELTWDKPKYISKLFKNNRWRKFMTNYRKKDKKEHRLGLGRYLCRTWNKKHSENGEKLETFKVYFNRQMNLPDYKKSAVEKRLLWRHYCYKKPASW